MLIVATLIILIVGVVLFKIACEKYWEFAEYTGITITIAATVALIIELIVLPFCYFDIDARVAENQTRYEMLTYQYENNIYDNDNDIGKRELMTDIQDWNEDLAYNKKAQNNIWIGVFIPNVYDQFEFIELK